MPILITGFILLIFGVLAIYSVSIYESFTLTLKLIANGFWDTDPSNYFYFFRQLRNILIALGMALIVYKIPLKIFQKPKIVVGIFIILAVLQLAVFIPGIGTVLNGARGWIQIGNITTIQPSEFFKIGYVIFMSNWLLRKINNKNNENGNKILGKFITINLVLLFIFFLIPDLGTVVVLGLTGLIMLRYSGIKFKTIIIMLFGGILFAGLIGTLAGMISDKFDYIQERFTYFLSTNIDPENTDIGRQNQQALMAIGGGGFFGQGYGKGLQKFGYIPEAQSDFIFAAFSEEIGFIGNLILLSLYIYLCYYFLTNLYKVKDPFTKMVGVGIISLIMVQVFVNIAVNTKLMPNTGLTLPFISFGGTALMVNFIELTILYKIIKNK